ncbi:S9 family peptidase [bacterium]|nr:S9 family peptidase [bacterium]
MRAQDLGRFSTVTDPNLHPDGVRIAYTVSHMDVEGDRYVRQIHLWDGEASRVFTVGPGDARPRWSPDGKRIAFLRTAAAKGSVPQVAVMPTDGGEATIVTDFALGASEAEWAPDGERLAVVGATWLDEWADLDDDERTRRPRRITGAGYRFDTRGWIHDRRTKVYVFVPGEGEPEPISGEGDWFDSSVSWHPDGSSLLFVSPRHDKRFIDSGIQVWRVPADGSAAPEALVEPGMWSSASHAPDGTVHLIGLEGAWQYPDVPGLFRLADGELTQLAGDLDRSFESPSPAAQPAGLQWLADGSALSVLEDRGRLRVVSVGSDGHVSDVLGGDRLITGVAPRQDGSAFAFTSTSPTDPGELWWWEGGTERQLTDLNAAFRVDCCPIDPISFTVENDGVEIDAWVVLPPGDESVPLLLNIHGGPATQYGYGFFDEFQVYAGSGFGVVACNPRGSSGRGRDFIRTPVGRWPEERPPDLEDILAVVAGALERFDRLDADRMGIMGGSYGGFMTGRILAMDDRWKCAVPERGLYDFTGFAGTSDIGHRFPRMYLGDWSYEDWSDLWAASPMSRAHKITTPCLILHSESDWRCPIEQGEQLQSVLVACGVEVEMLRFPGGSHELSRSGAPRHRQERFEAIVEWNGRHLAVQSPSMGK